MKHISPFLAGIFCFFSIAITAQTLELENKYLDEAAASGRTNKKQVEARRQKLKELLASPDYPSVPYDTTTGNFDFRFTIDVPAATQAALYKKIRTWSAATYIRDNTGVRYADSLSSIIVVLGYTDLRFTNSVVISPWSMKECRYSLTLTAKDGTVNGQFRSVEYVTLLNSGGVDDHEILESTQKFSTLFPLSSSYHLSMERYVNLIKRTAADFKKVELDLKNYLSGDSR